MCVKYTELFKGLWIEALTVTQPQIIILFPNEQLMVILLKRKKNDLISSFLNIKIINDFSIIFFQKTELFM